MKEIEMFMKTNEVMVDERKVPHSRKRVFRGYFHEWGQYGSSSQEASYFEMCGIVEDAETGQVCKVDPEAITFVRERTISDN